MSENNKFFQKIFSHKNLNKIDTSSCIENFENYEFNSKRRTSRKNLLLSIIAVVQIIAILVVSTSAWIESISSIVLSSKGAVDQRLCSVAEINATDKEIDLTKYFKKAGNIHFSEAKLDGNSVVTKKVNADGTSSAYRKPTINDINVNYIDFSFYIKLPDSAQTTSFYFSKLPEIYLGGKLASDIRLSITVDNATTSTSVFGYNEDANTKKFDKYISETPLFTVKPGEQNKKLITIKMWLQPGDSNNYSGNVITVNSFSISQAVSNQTSLALLYNSPSAVSSYSIKNGKYSVGKVDYNMWIYNSATKKSAKMKRENNSLKWTVDLPNTFFKTKSDKITFYKCPASVKDNPQKKGNYTESWTTSLSEAKAANSRVYTVYGAKSGTWQNEALLRPSTEDTAKR